MDLAFFQRAPPSRTFRNLGRSSLTEPTARLAGRNGIRSKPHANDRHSRSPGAAEGWMAKLGSRGGAVAVETSGSRCTHCAGRPAIIAPAARPISELTIGLLPHPPSVRNHESIGSGACARLRGPRPRACTGKIAIRSARESAPVRARGSSGRRPEPSAHLTLQTSPELLDVPCRGDHARRAHRPGPLPRRERSVSPVR